MMSDTSVFTQSLSGLSVMFKTAAKAGVSIEIDAESVRNLAEQLEAMNRLFGNILQELEILRLTEAGRIGRTAVEELATSQACELIVDPQGKVIRPDFGRRS
jgi:enhancing lycopene biosynthesis protein 2